jgi:hypothetical protein
MRHARALALAALALALAACGGDDSRRTTRFEWRPVSGMECGDGSATGLAVSPGRSDALLVFLNGGGACWAEGACDATRGPFGPLEVAVTQQLARDSVLDRGLPSNPFAEFTFVFVPYCTGDVHAGDAVRSHGAAGTWNHHGRRNLEAALAWIATSLPRPQRVVVAGSSAGGFGTLLAYDAVRATWPATGPDAVAAALLDDSGPTFVGTAIPAALRDAWWDAWNLSSTVTPLCAGCRDDLSTIWSTLAEANPTDRFALLSTTADATIRAFFGGMTGGEFTPALAELAGFIEGLPTGNARVFRVGGPRSTDHVLLARPADYAAAGTPLLDWLRPLATGEGTFGSAGP